MGQFIYMLPERATPERLIEKYALGGRLGQSCAKRDVSHFPLKDGQVCVADTPDSFEGPAGTMLSITSDGLGCFPEKQVWERIEEPGGPGPWWLGYYPDATPTAADLERSTVVNGYTIALGDGAEWVIPPARKYPDGTGLPSVLRLEADGSETRSIQPAYRALWEELAPFAEAYYAALRGQTKAPEREGAAADRELPEIPLATCFRLLGVNYRLGRPEVNALALITDAARTYIGLAAIDFWGFAQLMASQGGEQGNEAASPDFTPPE